jgi:hypothetical protein
MEAALGTPAPPLPFVVPAPAEEGERKVPRCALKVSQGTGSQSETLAPT